MKLEFEDFTPYFERPPLLHELLGKSLDARKSKGRLLIVIPSYKDNERLKKLLSELGRQKMKDFDVAIIYGPNDSFLPFQKLGILHSKRKLELGFAGAAYAGQLIALRDGYEYVLVTDVDKYPASEDSLGLLLETADRTGADCTYGRCLIDSIQVPALGKNFRLGKPIPSGVWRFAWGLVRAEYLKAAGLVLLPLYMGCDDIEYAYRLHAGGGKHELVNEFVVKRPAVKRELIFSYVKNGGRTNYIYSNQYVLHNFPYAFFRRFPFVQTRNPFIRLLDLASLLKVFLAIDWHGMSFLQKRMPPVGEYGRKLREGRFGIFSWPKENGYVAIAKVKKADVDADLLVESDYVKGREYHFEVERARVETNAGKLRLFLKSLFRNYRPVICTSEITDIWLCLFDLLYVYDERGKAFYKVEWKKKLFGFGLFAVLLEMEWDCLKLFSKAVSAELFFGYGKGNFYGREVARKTASGLED